jgi:hypothetical protein
MGELGIDISGRRSKRVDEFVGETRGNSLWRCHIPSERGRTGDRFEIDDNPIGASIGDFADWFKRVQIDDHYPPRILAGNVQPAVNYVRERRIKGAYATNLDRL